MGSKTVRALIPRELGLLRKSPHPRLLLLDAAVGDLQKHSIGTSVTGCSPLDYVAFFLKIRLRESPVHCVLCGRDSAAFVERPAPDPALVCPRISES